MDGKIPRFSVEPVSNCIPEVGLWLAILNDSRDRLLYALRSIREVDLDAKAPIGINTIGTILYHIALTDLNWVYDNMLQQPYPAEIASLFPYPLTDANEHLTCIAGWRLEDYQQRLMVARAKVHDVFKPMSLEYFRELLRREQDFGPYEMTPESVLRHLAQHESEHRGEIQLLAGALQRGE